MDAIAEAASGLVSIAKARKLQLVTAESCTAGRLARALTDAPGASNVVHGGFVTYTKSGKTTLLGVSPELIASATPVSAKVALAMAGGALARSPADVAMAITGVAGPGPDEDGNPVGLVYAAVKVASGPSALLRLDVEGDKEAICASAISEVLKMARELLTKSDQR